MRSYKKTFTNKSSKKDILYLLKEGEDWGHSYSKTMNKTQHWRKNYKNAFFFYAHGWASGTAALTNEGGAMNLFAEEISSLLSQSGYTKGQDIVLMSCYTGAITGHGGDNIAQSLSNYMNATVYAPDGFIAISNVRDAYLTNNEWNPWAISSMSFLKF